MDDVLDEAALLALQVHALLGDLDPARWRADTAAVMRQRLSELEVRVAGMVATMRASVHAPQALQGQWALFLHELRAAWPDESSTTAMRDRWMAFRTHMVPAYEELAAHLRRLRIHVPSLRPTNYARNLMHLSSATSALLTVEFLPALALPIAVIMALSAWSMETGRRLSPAINARLMRLFRPVAHPHETHRVNSATWYATALVALAWSGATIPGAMAVTVLGIGDPIAALVGRRYGRTPLVHGRSLEGSVAFFCSAFMAAWAVLAVCHPALSTSAVVVTAAAAAAAGAIAELLSLRIDDNLSVPLAAAAGAWLVG
jgi:dolichol kinase